MTSYHVTVASDGDVEQDGRGRPGDLSDICWRNGPVRRTETKIRPQLYTQISMNGAQIKNKAACILQNFVRTRHLWIC